MGQFTDDVIASIDDNAAYLVGGRAIFGILPKGQHSLGAYDRWLELELAQVASVLVAARPNAHSLTRLAISMANNHAFRSTLQLDPPALVKYTAADQETLARFLRSFATLAPAERSSELLGKYYDWLEGEKKKVVIAIAGEAPIEDVLKASKQAELEGKVKKAQTTDARSATTAASDFLVAKKDKSATKQKILDLRHKYNYSLLRRTLINYSTAQAVSELKELQTYLEGQVAAEKAKQTRNQGKIDILNRDLDQARQLAVHVVEAQSTKATAKTRMDAAKKEMEDASAAIAAHNRTFVDGFGSLWEVWKKMKAEGRIKEGDPDYEAVLSIIALHAQKQRELMERRDVLELQVAQLAKIDGLKSGLTVYCGFGKVAYPVLRAIAGLVADDGGGFGLAVQGGLAFTSSVLGTTKALATESAKEVFGLSGMPLLDTAKLAKCTAVGTGELKITIAFGLAYGVSDVASLGCALVYSGSIEVSDDRKFRAKASLSLKGSFKAGHEKVLQAAAEADLVKSTTVFSFADAEHWAAWLSQKWANTAAWAFTLGTNVYQGSKTDAPTQEELEFMRVVADAYLDTDPELRSMLDRISPVLLEPVSRGDSLAFVPRAKGELSAASTLGTSVEILRPTGTTYYMRKTEDGRLIEKEKTDTKQGGWGTELTLPALKVSYKYSKTENHPNPDNTGENRTVGLVLGDTARKWVKKTEKPDDMVVPDWANKLASASDSFKEAAIGEQTFWFENGSVEFAQSLNVAQIEANWQYQTATIDRKEVKQWQCQYIRGVYATELSTSVDIPTPVPGLKLTFSGKVEFTRTFGEYLPAQTLSYVVMVYNGFKSIKQTELRGERWGGPKWATFKKAHASELANICAALGTKKEFIYHELMDLAEQTARGAAETLRRECEKYAGSRTSSNLTSALAALDKFLETYHDKVWKAHKEEGWKPTAAPASKYWLVNAIMGPTERQRLETALGAAQDELNKANPLPSPTVRSAPVVLPKGPSVSNSLAKGSSTTGGTLNPEKGSLKLLKSGSSGKPSVLLSKPEAKGSSGGGNGHIRMTKDGNCFFAGVAFWWKETQAARDTIMARAREGGSGVPYAAPTAPEGERAMMKDVRLAIADWLCKQVYAHGDQALPYKALRLRGFEPEEKMAFYDRFAQIWENVSHDNQRGRLILARHCGTSLFDYLKKLHCADTEVIPELIWGNVDLCGPAVQALTGRPLVVRQGDEVVIVDGTFNRDRGSYVQPLRGDVPLNAIKLASVDGGTHFDVFR